MVTLPYCLTIATEGILRHQIAKILQFFYVFRRVFPIFFVATVGSSTEFGAFDKIARSMELHVRFDFRCKREFSIEFEDVARLITANLVLLVYCWF